jgi:Thrombospondin type 3 repeat
MIKTLFALFVGRLLLWSAFANIEFIQSLEKRWIDVNSILVADRVTREDVAELLNVVECQNCRRPSATTVSSLSIWWWNVFRLYPGKNFDDVNFNNVISQSQDNNFYCIAYVGNKWYMNWFPRSTSPVCSGKFCGINAITVADVVQTVFNISMQSFFSQYKANWNEIRSRYEQQAQQQKNYFNLEDIATIQSASKVCVAWTECEIASIEQLKAYVKYCTFEPQACGIQELPFAKKAQWPIAEMNILLQQWIFTLSDLQNFNVDTFASWRFVIDILWRVKQRVQCVDVYDQDADGIEDMNDNCYIHPNPEQADNDNDGIWNACDDDIDNDSIKNPIWIIDDQWNIVYEVIRKTENAWNIYWLAISQIANGNNAYNFTAVYRWDLQDFRREFWDWKKWVWETTSNTYGQNGEYVLRLTAKTKEWKEVEAVSTIKVNNTQQIAVKQAAMFLPNQLIQTVWESYWYKLIYEGIAIQNIDYVKINRWDGRVKEYRGWDTIEFIDVYSKAWSYTVWWTVYLKDGTTLPIWAYITVNDKGVLSKEQIDNCLLTPNTNQQDDDANRVGDACDVWLDDRVWLRAVPRALTQDRFAFTAQYSWTLTNITWYFGDRNTGKWDLITHTYRNPWQYTVRVEGDTPSWKRISATTYVSVGGERAALLPSKLIQSVWEKVPYSIQLFWILPKDIDYVQLVRWDGRERQLRGGEIVSFIDAYNNYWGYPIGWTVYLLNGKTLSLSAYVTVIWTPYCFWNINNTRWGVCDMDKDSIPDICDSDVDGDWVLNQLWIIVYQNSACTYDEKNVDIARFTNTWNRSRDNCPFTSNPLQWPCTLLDRDSDGDGIPNDEDACPTIPEDFNWVSDVDGCPEININVVFPMTKLQPWLCNSCPCQFAKNDSTLDVWDRVKAVLFDRTTAKPIAESNRFTVQ